MWLGLCSLIFRCHGDDLDDVDIPSYDDDDEIMKKWVGKCTQEGLSANYTRDHCQDYWLAQMSIQLTGEGFDR